MIETTQSTNYFAVAASIPPSTVSLEAILCTEELRRRPWRPPDYEKEEPCARGAGRRVCRVALEYPSETG
jgi:hypothetical protein